MPVNDWGLNIIRVVSDTTDTGIDTSIAKIVGLFDS
jgi:hypothetical protein